MVKSKTTVKAPFFLKPTFNNIAVNRSPELFFGPLVEVLTMYDAHLLEESRFAALSSSE